MGTAFPVTEYVIGFVPIFRSDRKASPVYYYTVPGGGPLAGKCQVFSNITCQAVGDPKCKTASGMTVTVDIKNQIRESNERNNSKTFVLKPTPTPHIIPRPTISPFQQQFR